MILIQCKLEDLSMDFREFGNNLELQTDLETRDFTCNGLYVDPRTLEVLDFVQGVEHIKNKIICPINSFEKTFLRDFSRFMRIVRFRVTKGFSISKDTEREIKSVTSNEIDSYKRGDDKNYESTIRELKKFFNIAKPHKAFNELIALDLARLLFWQGVDGNLIFTRAANTMKKIYRFTKTAFYSKLKQYFPQKLRLNVMYKLAFVIALLHGKQAKFYLISQLKVDRYG